MSIQSILNSEAGMALVATTLGGIWTAFQSTEWYRRAQSRRYARAVHALEAGVELTYRTYVQVIKESREDGKLTPEECREARRRAIETAIDYGRREGINVARELGPEYLDLLVAKLVKGLKQ